MSDLTLWSVCLCVDGWLGGVWWWCVGQSEVFNDEVVAEEHGSEEYVHLKSKVINRTCLLLLIPPQSHLIRPYIGVRPRYDLPSIGLS